MLLKNREWNRVPAVVQLYEILGDAIARLELTHNNSNVVDDDPR